MAEIDVSILMGTYNSEKYVRKAIESVLAQKDLSFELIVIDDCSKDGTWDIIASFDDPRMIAIKADENAGCAGTRNKMIAMARGTWITVVDDDDYIEPDRMSRCLATLKAAGADVVVDQQNVYYENTQTFAPMDLGDAFAAMTTLNVPDFIAGNSNFFAGHTLGYLKPIFSADFIKKHDILYSSEAGIATDYMFLLEILAAGGKCVIEKYRGYRYTVRKGSYSSVLKAKDLQAMIKRDEVFIDKYALDVASLKAQKFRTYKLQQGVEYLNFVEAVKAGEYGKAAAAFFQHPLSMYLLWRPVWNRIRRCVKKTAPGGNAVRLVQQS